jgi:glycosyltransferase involved in cell wall biosynthesis
MTIVIVHDYASWRPGQANVAILSAVGLAERGHRVVFLAGTGTPDRRLHGLEVHTFDQPTAKGIRGIYNVDAARRTSALLSGLGEEVVMHIHACSDVLSASVLRAAADLEIPVVYTAHDFHLGCPTGQFFSEPEAKHCPHQGLSKECWTSNCTASKLGDRLFYRARHVYRDQVIHPKIRHVIFPSPSAQDALMAAIPLEIPQSVVPTIVGVDRMEPAKVGSEFVAVGEVSRARGSVVLAQAGWELGIPIAFLGDGPAAKEVQSVNRDALVTGWMDMDTVFTQMETARAVVSPSIALDPDGWTVQMAQAMGIAVIATDRGAPKDFVINGFNGILCRPGSVAALGDAMTELSPDAAQELGYAAFSRYWSNPASLDRHLDAVEAVYVNLER